ncbi:hypothetical protein [Brevundimonas sp. NIBR11]|uniref:hypothetical protein n=1 Tax=Brevundimonas sp. NIBR11 TaxID=3015999 RepID=UPI0022F06576|nr:hypothetical protein [Brevundimonas sp. NIBR11]WGM31518.1 hypothetical protein KKHFBJBL_01765 [Brevundimonas sp. NIBR11]
MRYAKLLLLTATVSLAFSSAACSTVPIATGCSELARSVLTRSTPHAEIGDSGDPTLDWQLYGAAETGQLNKANDDKATGFAIINACEVRDAEVTARLARPWYRRLLPG